MANTCDVIPFEWPGFDAVDTCLKLFIAQKFPQFRVERMQANYDGLEDGWFILAGPVKDQVCLQVYPKLCVEPYTFGEKEEPTDAEWKAAPRKRGVMFEHGHGWQFLWWVENELRAAILDKFPGYEVDSGCGTPSPKMPHYPTYYEYLRSQWLLPHPRRRPGTFHFEQRLADEKLIHMGLKPELQTLLGFPA